MSSRGALLAVAGAAVLVGGCQWLPHRRNTGARAGMDAATVFETKQPYTTRKLESGDLGKFLAKHPEYRADSASIAEFYQRRDGQFAWIIGDSLSSSAESFIAFAGAVDSTAPNKPGFSPHVIELYEQSATGGGSAVCAGCATDLELHLTGEFFKFAARKYGGYLNRDVGELDWFIPKAKKDPGMLLDSLAKGQMDLTDYEPVHPQYQLLKRGIERYRALTSEPWPALALPPGKKKKIEPGDSAAVIGDIRHRMQLLGDSSDDRAGNRYDSTMGIAVKNFQARHGVQADGIIGPTFLAAINVPVSDRLRTMLVNIERLRWVPEEPPATRLEVNIPEFRLHVFENAKEVMTMDVVVGKAATRTVIFSDTLTQIVFSPSWTVPSSIVRNEIRPAMRKDPNYLAEHNMDVVGGPSDNQTIRQRPGPTNPLGGVKFLFPNSFDIYMHDTPAKALFDRDNRAASHGCIRLSRPADLAAYLLRSDPEWTPERIHEAMTSGHEMMVKVREPRPVTIGYFTSWVDAEGRLNFRDDVYGHDAKLARELFVQ